MSASIRIIRCGAQSVAVSPASLGASQFQEFKNLCKKNGLSLETLSNGKFANIGSIDSLILLIEEFKKNGFSVELDNDLDSYLRNKATKSKAYQDAADSRIAITNDLLKSENKSLYNYQENAIKFLAETPAALLSDSMGLGKTISAAVSFNDECGVIIVCPASIVNVWLNEIKNIRSKKIMVLNWTNGINKWPSKGEIFLTTYACIPTNLPDLEPNQQITLIADEAHKLKGGKKNKTGKSWHTLKNKVSGKPGCFVWLLTGTPLKNRLIELWNVLEAADLGVKAFGNYKTFKSLAPQIEEDADIALDIALRNDSEFTRRLKTVMLRRTKRDSLPFLPPKERITVNAVISEETRKELDQALEEIKKISAQKKVDDYVKEVESNGGIADSKRIEEVRQDAFENVNEAIELVWNGSIRPPFELTSRVKSILALAKIQASNELVSRLEEEYCAPIIFFSQHVKPVEIIGSRPGWCYFTGETKRKERTSYVEAFQSGSVAGIAITGQAGGEGLTLTRCGTDKDGNAVAIEVFNDISWTPADNDQCEDRAHRIGQLAKKILVFRVVAKHPLDERINFLNEQKQKLTDATIGPVFDKPDNQRQSIADKIGEVTNTVKKIDPNSIVSVARRKAKSEVEEWALRRMKQWQGEVLSGITNSSEDNKRMIFSFISQFNKHGGLSDKQWIFILNWAKNHSNQEKSKTPNFKQIDKDWVIKEMTHLIGQGKLGPKFTAFVSKASSIGLSLGEWKRAEEIVRKLRNKK